MIYIVLEAEVIGRPGAPLLGSGPEADQLLVALVRVAQAGRRRGIAPGPADPPALASLAPRHLAALTQVVFHGPLTVSALAERLGVALTTTSLLVSQLADAGLVERREDAADHRRTLASIRPDRSEEVLRLVDAHLQPLRRTLERLGRRRAGALLEDLDVLTQELSRRSVSAADSSTAAQPSGAPADTGAGPLPTGR